MSESEERNVDIKKQYSGTTYQIKVLLLLLCRGKKIQNNEHFYLRTEVKDAEKFDDALFYYRKKGETKYNVRYCQIKNSESKNAELTYANFVSDFDKAVANIKKYFISYRKIKMRTINENVQDFILCTSYKLPLELKKDAKVNNDEEKLKFCKDDTPDELFDVDSGKWKRYKLLKTSLELQNNLAKTTNLDLLAEEFIESIIKSKKQNSSTRTIDFKNFWLSQYQSALILEEVIIEKTFVTNDGRILTNKNGDYVFSEKFLKNTGISKECEDFRNIFLNRCGAKLMNIFLREKEFPANESFKNILSKNEKKLLGNIQMERIEKSAKQIAELLFNEKSLTKKIAIQNQFFEKVFKINGVRTVKFAEDFVQNKNLPKATEQFRENLLLFYAAMELETLKLKLIQNKKATINVENGYKSLINNDNEKEMKEFFNKFSIQTMPHHDELMDVIKKEIGEEFNLLEDKWITNSLLQKIEEWFKRSEEVPFDMSMIDKYYDEIKKDVMAQMAEGNSYVEMLKTFNLSYNEAPENWKTYIDPINSNHQTQLKQILLLTTEEPILTAIKLQNVINSFNFFRKPKSYFIIAASILLQMENTANYITNALKSMNCYNLIIIVDDNKAITTTLFKNHLKTLDNKFILITTEKATVYENIKQGCTFQEETDQFNFNELTSASQQYVLEKSVLFQGTNVSLRTIISDAFNLIDAKTIMKLVSNKTILEIGTILVPYKEYDEKTYIEREIGLIKMKEDFFAKAFPNSLFLIEGKTLEISEEFLKHKNVDVKRISSGKWNSHTPFLLVTSKNVEYIFNQLCKENPNLQIYWLKLENDELFWFHCSGSALSVGVKESPTSFTETHYLTEENAFNFLSQSKTVIITDAPGMGKSTILTNLFQRINNDIIRWKIRIDLNKYTKYFLDIKEKRTKGNNNFQDIEKYVMDKIFGRLPPNVEEKPFEFRIFDQMYDQNKVFLIFDGFDEIIPDYENVALEMFEIIRNSTQNHLWITSRLNMKQILERKLKTISLKLKPFDCSTQHQFLIKFWKSNWQKNWSKSHERHLRLYARVLINHINKTTERNGTDIIGIPLQTKMLGDFFQENDESDVDWQSCFKFLEKTANCESKKCKCFPYFGKQIQNLYILYEAFVKKHISRHLYEKAKNDSSKVGSMLMEKLLYNEVLETYKVLGIFAFVNDSQLKNLVTEEEYKIKIQRIEEMKVGNSGFGLISVVSEDDTPLFTHLTFAEYFAANYLIKKLISHPIEVFNVIDVILQSNVPVFLYCLKHLITTKICNETLEEALDNTTLVNFVAKYGLFNCLKYFTMEDDYQEFFPQIDKFKMTPLHFSVKFDQIKCVIFILLQKYNRFSKYKEKNFKSKYKRLIYVERDTRLFLLQEFIKLNDTNGNSALDYSANSKITDLLNDFVEIGQNNLKPKKAEKAALSLIQCFPSKYDFTKSIEGNGPAYLIKDIIYLCSFETLTAVIDNFENVIVNEGHFSSDEIRNFFENICSRSDYSENEKIDFFNKLLAKSSLSHLRQEIVREVLQSSIINDNWEVFKHCFYQENIRRLPRFYRCCFGAACTAKNLKVINFLFENLENKRNLFDFICPGAPNMFFLKEIFKHFDGNAELERRYGEMHMFEQLYVDKDLSADILKYLLSKGAKIYSKDEFGFSPWLFAITTDDEEIIKTMIPNVENLKEKSIVQKYYDVENENQDFNFFLAFELEDEEVCSFLISKSKNVNKKDDTGKTLLVYACEKGWFDVVKLLLKMGACYEDVFDKNGELFECYRKNDEIVVLLNEVKHCFKSMTMPSSLEDTSVYMKAVNKFNQPLWYIAASRGEIRRIIRGFHEIRYDDLINMQDLEGNTSLHLAAKGGFKEIVKKLLEMGAYYNVKNKQNKTPWDLTTNNKILTIFKKIDYLFESVTVNEEFFGEKLCKEKNHFIFEAKDALGRTLLHYAVINGFYLYAKTILRENPHCITEKDIYQKTALCYAAENNDAKMVKLLLRNGLFIMPDKKCLENIKDNYCTRFIKIMEKLFSDLDNEDTDAFLEKIDFFCRSPFPGLKLYDILSVIGKMGRFLLQHVVDLNNYAFVITLLKKGVVASCVEKYDCCDARILHIFKFINKVFRYVKSKAYNTWSIIQLIEENDCTEIIVNARTFRDTLLHIAVEVDNLKMVIWLIQHGTDLSAKNFFGDTAIQLAYKSSNKNIITFLEEYAYFTNTDNSSCPSIISSKKVVSLNINKILSTLNNLTFQQPMGNEIRKVDGTIIARHDFRDMKDWIKFYKDEVNITTDSLFEIVNVVDILTINIISKKMIPDVAYFSPEWWQGINSFKKTSMHSIDEMIEMYCVNLSETTRFIFFPLVIEAHWITFAYEVTKNKLTCYDPNYKYYDIDHWKRYYEIAKTLIEKFIFIFYQQRVDTIQMERLGQDYNQEDTISAGLFVSKYMEIVMDGGMFFKSFDCNTYRMEIIELFNQITGEPGFLAINEMLNP